MNHGFERDVAVIGIGRIGLPWSAVLAAECEYDVTCIDIDKDRVECIRRGEVPFEEPELDGHIKSARSSDHLQATTDETAISRHKYVAITVNAERNLMHEFLDIVEAYSTLLEDDQVVINRTTLPVGMVEQTESVIQEYADGTPDFTVFPERLAEGSAIQEIRTLPKVVGVEDAAGESTMRTLLEPLGSPVHTTDPKTAMFVKLIDNSYRDGLFALANQIAYAADQLGLNAHTAIELANMDYPRNDIPSPGTVGGKCLPKDTHFLMDETICEQPTTPDLFSATRRTNALLPSYLTTEILCKQPNDVAFLGMAYKRNVGDTYNSSAMAIIEALERQGVSVKPFDPHVNENDGTIADTLNGADVVVLAVNHPEFEDIEPHINEHATDADVFDIWGLLDPEQIEAGYDGLGINNG